MDEKAIRTLLGLDDTADIAETIRGMQSTIAAQKAVIETDTATAEKAEVAVLRNDLAEARRKLIIAESENARKIAALEEDTRRERVIARVERAIGREGKPPRMRDQMLEVGMMMVPDKFDEFLATIPSIDMTERGVATGHELAELEPTAGEMATARNMGLDPSSKEWRLGIMRQKAQAKGLALPAEVA